MATVCEAFSKLFSYVLLFEQVGLQEAEQPTYEQVHGEIVTLLEQQETAAKQRGVLDRDCQEARFAFVAWADETILRLTDWEHHRRWQSMPLQLEYFQTRNAGEEFFERLERLSKEQREVREVYYFSLGLGFKGRYFLGMEDDRTLNQLRHQLAQDVPVQIEDLQGIAQLTPQPYEVSAEHGKPIKPPVTGLLFKLGVALLVTVPLAVCLIYWILKPPPEIPVPIPLTVTLAGNGLGTVSSTPAGIFCGSSCSNDFQPQTVVTLVATPEPGSTFVGWHGEPDCEDGKITLSAAATCTGTFDKIQIVEAATIQELLRKALQCADVTVDVQRGNVRLAGRVASETQRDQARRIAQGVEGVAEVNDALSIIPRPFCKVVELLQPFKDHAETQAFGLAMRLNKASQADAFPTYLKGENLVLEVQSPTGFPSHIYADYYTADGFVGHLFPNAEESQRDFRPGEAYTVGRLDGPRPWVISSPFGLEMVTVIASKKSLIDPPRLDPDAAMSYIEILQQALQMSTPEEVAAAFYFIRTRDRP